MLAAIEKDFGDFEAFRKEMTEAALNRFGSGWAWLIVEKTGKLKIVSSPNQDNTLMDASGTPILGIDVWEHAYYLKYQNRRPDYLAAWWSVVNWEKAESLFNAK